MAVTESTSMSSSLKRKRLATSSPHHNRPSERSYSQEIPRTPISKIKRVKSSTPKSSPMEVVATEKRLRRFRKHAPSTYLEKLHRATSQRMFVIDRSRSGTLETPTETIQLAGTTGNVYSITIDLIPTCSCPDCAKGNQCKHIVYVLHNVLKAPEHLQYQLALTSSELREILNSAPLPPPQTSSDSTTSNRKDIDGDCPICFTEFEPSTEEIVYCKAACGINIHRECFEKWAKSQSSAGVRCVYCRAPWQGDEDSLKRISKDQKRVNGEGYINVAGELGLSGARDYSTYHQPWVRSQGYGYY